MSGEIWIMNINSDNTLSNLQDLVSSGHGSIQTPVWSPEGKYIAFLRYSGSGRSFYTAGEGDQEITFFDISNPKKLYTLDLSPIFSDYRRPGAYMSWVK